MSAVVHVPPPRVCERLDDMLSRFGGVRSDGHFVSRLPGGRVFGPGIVLAPDGRSLARDVSADYGKPFHEHWLLTYSKIRPPIRLPGETAVAAVTLGHRYYHWLLEEFPRLLALRGRGPETIIAHTRAPFFREAHALGSFALHQIREARRYSHYECEQLLVPVLGAPDGQPTIHAIGLLTEFTEPWRTQHSAFGDRLYISREQATRRRVANEAELWESLEARGFRKLVMEALSWKEQVNAFSQARVVVAPHGGGLANLAFCRPGTRVIEFFNQAYMNPCYERLAATIGLEYRPIAEVRDQPSTCDPMANRHNITADVPAIMDALINC